MCFEDTVRIPLRAKDGSVRAYSLVDAADADWVNQWRWCLNSHGYAKRSAGYVNGVLQQITLHRALLGLTPGDGLEGDHINRDRLDNRRVNLRAIPRAANRQNASPRRDGASSYRGVNWRKEDNNWSASLQVNGKRLYLGRFKIEEEAAKAVQEARRRFMPYAVD